MEENKNFQKEINELTNNKASLTEVVEELVENNKNIKPTRNAQTNTDSAPTSAESYPRHEQINYIPPSHAQSTSSPRLCKFFLQSKCNQNSNCKYIHPNPQSMQSNQRPRTKLCRFYNSPSGCHKDNCMFIHRTRRNQQCRNYTNSECRYGEYCLFSHTISRSTPRIQWQNTATLHTGHPPKPQRQPLNRTISHLPNAPIASEARIQENAEMSDMKTSISEAKHAIEELRLQITSLPTILGQYFTTQHQTLAPTFSQSASTHIPNPNRDTNQGFFPMENLNRAF